MDAECPSAQVTFPAILWRGVVVLRCMQRKILLSHDLGFEEQFLVEREAEGGEEDRQHGR